MCLLCPSVRMCFSAALPRLPRHLGTRNQQDTPKFECQTHTWCPRWIAVRRLIACMALRTHRTQNTHQKRISNTHNTHSEVPKADSVRCLTVCRVLVLPRSAYTAIATNFPISARQVCMWWGLCICGRGSAMFVCAGVCWCCHAAHTRPSQQNSRFRRARCVFVNCVAGLGGGGGWSAAVVQTLKNIKWGDCA